jgi:hypothetical protein
METYTIGRFAVKIDNNQLFINNNAPIIIKNAVVGQALPNQYKHPDIYCDQTLLVHLEDLNYIYIGNEVCQFQTKDVVNLIDYHLELYDNSKPCDIVTDRKQNRYILIR